MDDAATIESFVDGFNTAIGVYNTPLQDRFCYFGAGMQTDIRTVFNGTWLVKRLDQAVMYVNNHDTQVGQALGSLNVGGWFRATCLCFDPASLRGLPLHLLRKSVRRIQRYWQLYRAIYAHRSQISP